MVDLSIARLEMVECAGAMKEKYEKSWGENRKIGNECQVEGSNAGEIFPMARGSFQNRD